MDLDNNVEQPSGIREKFTEPTPSVAKRKEPLINPVVRSRGMI